MGSIGAAEILVILVVGLLVLGPERLPATARQFGNAMREFRKYSGGMQGAVRDFMNDPEAAAARFGPAPEPAVALTDDDARRVARSD